MRILCIDCGSSSLKFAAYDFAEGERRLARGAAEGLGQSEGRFWVDDAADVRVEDSKTGAPWDLDAALPRMESTLKRIGAGSPDAVGHRLVFGGPNRFEPMRIAPGLLGDLEEFAPLFPIHLPAQLEALRATASRYPGVPQVACFDTAFFRGMPPVARHYALPRETWRVLQRYGYHGLSYEYVLSALGDLADGRLLVAHLGSGASMAAILDGVPLDTTMGFSPLGGLMMGTRPGDLDPGALAYFASAGKYARNELLEALYERCGLLAVSQRSASMQALLEVADSDAAARQAIDLFIYQAVKHAAAMAAVLGGLDAFAFTGGIGERSPFIRARICEGLTHLGIRLDSAANAIGADVLSSADSRVRVHLVHTDENLMVARHTNVLLKKQ